MRQRSRLLLPSLLAAAVAAPSLAWAQAARFGSGEDTYGVFTGDALGRYEWTRNIPGDGDETTNESRWRLQWRPRFEASVGVLRLGVGAELNYSQDRNYKPPEGESELLILRDNYRSRDARLDLAYARLELGVLEIEGGRFVMPIAFTEMLWDRDLRPQGGAVSLVFGGDTSATRLALRGLYAIGSHVYEDESSVYGGAAELTLGEGTQSQLQIVGSYLQFQDLHRLDPALRRQNTVADEELARDYRVADLVARLVTNGPMTLVADYCWNTALSSENRGLWLAAKLGALGVTRTTIEYTYARVDKDATVAAFNADDFYWNTGWEGHRIDVSAGSSEGSGVHAITQWQRAKTDDETTADDEWVKRWRLEWHSSF